MPGVRDIKPCGDICIADLSGRYQALFQEKDVKDSRYFYKRAFFVSVLKEHIEASGLCETVSVAYLNRNQRKPVLEVTPKSSTWKTYLHRLPLLIYL